MANSNPNLTRENIEKRMAMHRALVENNGQGFFAKKKTNYKPLIFIIVIGAGAALMSVLFGGHGIFPNGESRNQTSLTETVEYGGRVYEKYDVPGTIVKSDTDALLGEAERGSFYELCEIYSLKGYDVNEWLAVLYEGKFWLMRAKY
ncbi:hypothetical protein FACS189490_04590 [Clostridia bacterium]|nr:hypothetical protein FACS189490_04590 [Clostridia bacterium]